MSNHLHFAIEVGDIHRSKIMQAISTRYAKLSNAKYNNIGHLFQGRFKSNLILDDHYLLALCYYIHMNPVKAKMCRTLDEYQWNSHHKFIYKEKSCWLTVEYIIEAIHRIHGQDTSYIKFMSNNENVDSGAMFCKVSDDGTLTINTSMITRFHNRPSLAIENIFLDRLANIICHHLQVSLDKICSDSQARRINLARSMIA